MDNSQQAMAAAWRTYEMVFFSVVLDSGRARLSTLRRSLVLALILVCR